MQLTSLVLSTRGMASGQRVNLSMHVKTYTQPWEERRGQYKPCQNDGQGLQICPMEGSGVLVDFGFLALDLVHLG